MRHRTFYVRTFGCRLNQFDSALVEHDLRERGWRPARTFRDAAVVVANTCTVTRRADSDARRFAHRVKRGNPTAILVLTGCYATRNTTLREKIPQIDFLVSNADKARIAEIVERHARQEPVEHVYDGDILKARELDYAPLERFFDKSRAFLKVQDGCDARCTFCIIPAVRGASRSLPPGRIEEQARRFAEAGHPEIVLTGIHLGRYGLDLNGEGVNLARLVERLLKIERIRRLRLSSIEPLEVTDELVRLAAGEERIAPHFHVPLQSGSDAVLRRMGRPYQVSQYARVLERVGKNLPDAGIGADVLVGFPGETSKDFDATLRFVERSNLTYLHVFRYSPRPGTAALRFREKVPGRAASERGAQLRNLSRRLNLRFRRAQEGKIQRAALLESRSGAPAALTGNYIEVSLSAPPDGAGNFFPLRIERATAKGTWGRVAAP
ncbi:MAG: tRNA (N(6)-L-threonylcarbamoyladenosine(37)-C(2))-methylthiotransferase MtaB [Acidobacteriota bacterium]|nr:MAG: tRNA (N(6)-L-threonylcarbamoyladenosine(37)-C(2))-methylthiotransferase MtaB [Acidobacteriota bacterium]